MKANKLKSKMMLRSRKKKSVILSSIILAIITSANLVNYLGQAIAPTIDYSHNMRILKLPQSTPIGSLIYRLKGSDGDANSQLTFGLSGHEARTLLDVVPVPRSWNEADIYLRSKPDKSHYNFTLFVTDGNKTTSVESTILITDDEQQHIELQHNSSSSSSSPTNSLLPFLNTKHIFHVPENAKPNELIGSLSVLESEKSDLPVRFELRGKGSERFSINYVFGPKGQSKGEIVLGHQELDYEKQNLFSLKVLALNAWADTRFDTRNVASMDIVITVGDVQDSPPVFRNLPQSIRLATNLKAGQLVYKCEAEDGDFADQRPIQYALDANSPLASYFGIDKSSGEIRLTKSISELLMHAAWQSSSGGSQSMLTIFASELPDPSSYDHLWPPMYARVEIPLLLVDTQNEAPQFLGGWQTAGSQTKRAGQPQIDTLHGYLPEWTGDSNNINQQQQQQQLVVRWFTNSSSSESSLLDGLSKSLGNRPSVLDLGLGSNGTFELTLEGADAELFHLEPSGFPISRQTTFSLSVAEHANKSLFDHEYNNKLSHLFTVDVVARDFGQPERLSSKIRCLIELVDTNDNWPRFESDLYSFSVYENAPIGFALGQVRARDSDSSAAKVSYVSLSGADSHLFRLNEDTGQVTLEAHLDREKKSVYLFLVEARDSTSDHGLSNYTQMIINVLDVNDNAPIFLQSHYDAVLLSDGSFFQPLQVKAVDTDEPGTANSQVAYEIIAGNSNEQFSIDSVSGVIYPNTGGGGQYQPAPLPAELPSSLKEPILPHRPSPSNGPDRAGKIKPQHEVEDSPRASRRLVVGNTFDRQQQEQRPPPQSKQEVPTLDVEQLSALDLLMSLESAAAAATGLPGQRTDISSAAAAAAARANQLGPITTLVVRAHDFGIPLRSSTVRVNIFNQALLTRSVSLILNGTIEQLDSKRDAIERAFSSLTGSRATIESLDALSDSSSLSVARVRLQVPEHSLVDLTDLSALMSAIEYRTHQDAPAQQQQPPPTFYYPSSLSNLSTSQPGSGGASTHLGHNIFSDIHSYAIDSNAALERRLLVYIIIVGVCILALLLAWMIYYCCSRNEQKSPKLISNSSTGQLRPTATYRPTAAAAATDAANKTHAKMAAGMQTTNQHHGVGSPIANNLAKVRHQQFDEHSISSNLLAPMAGHATNRPAGDANQTSTISTKPSQNYSMYNGQVWFEPNNGNSLLFRHLNRQQQQQQHQQQQQQHQQQHKNTDQSIASLCGEFGPERRASSAPSGGPSLDSTAGRGARNASGQFFPNTLGYAQNVASIVANQPDAYSRTSGQTTTKRRSAAGKLRSGKSKVAPMPDSHQAGGSRSITAGHTNNAFVADEYEDDADNNDKMDLEAGRSARGHRDYAKQRQHRKQSSLDSTTSGSTATGGTRGNGTGSIGDEISTEAPASSSLPVAEMSVELDSDQELLGFDSTGTPIIATHTRSTRIKPIVVERARVASSSVSQPSSRSLVDHPPARREEVKAPKADGAAGELAATAEPEQSETRQEQADDERDMNQNRPRKVDEEEEEGGGGEPGQKNEKSTTGVSKPQLSSSSSSSMQQQTSNPLMSELTERISSRKGSANNDVEPPSVATVARSGTDKQEVTSASNKRQLMLRQGKTTTSTKSQTGSESADDRSSTADTLSISSRARELASMKNGELLEKKSIFALTYNGLATDKLPD